VLLAATLPASIGRKNRLDNLANGLIATSIASSFLYTRGANWLATTLSPTGLSRTRESHHRKQASSSN
jgi:hypothetical protein